MRRLVPTAVLQPRGADRLAGMNQLLLVEDDDEFRETCALWMSRKGHEVTQAANGQEALHQFSRRHFEVAVMGCAVNGPGEAGDADFGIAGGRDAGHIYAHGEVLKRVPQDELVDELFRIVDQWIADGMKGHKGYFSCDIPNIPLDKIEWICKIQPTEKSYAVGSGSLYIPMDIGPMMGEEWVYCKKESTDDNQLVYFVITRVTHLGNTSSSFN